MTAPTPASLYADAARVYPDISLPLLDFERFVAPLACSSEELASLRGPDLFLACACLAGDAAAIAHLEALLRPLVAAAQGRRSSAEQLEETAQLARARLLVAAEGARPKIAEYAGRGPLSGWLRVVVLRVAANERRREKQHDPLSDSTPAQIGAASPEHLLARARWQKAFDMALRDSFASLDREERAVLRMQLAKGMSLEQLATVLGVHRATVARRLAAAKQKLQRGVSERLQQRLGLSEGELSELADELRSKLEVSLGALLATES